MADDPLIKVFETQSAVCASFGSPFYGDLTARVAAGLSPAMRGLFAEWDGQSFEAMMDAAVSLRFLGALHERALSGDDPALTAAFPPNTDGDLAWTATQAAVEAHGPRLKAFMAHEPQTNEVRRSACLLPGFLTLAVETGGLPLRCLEIGASAGLNQLWSRFRYDLGAGGVWGDVASPLLLTTDWTGAQPPLAAPIRVAETAACDRKPIEIADPAQRRRLKAYLWPDQTERTLRFDIAADMALAAAVHVETADAAEWALARAAPQAGVTTVLYHSIFWQYLPPQTQTDIRDALNLHGAKASADAPLAWLRMEPVQGQMAPIELRLTIWPSGEERLLAHVHAHGAWVRWLA